MHNLKWPLIILVIIIVGIAMFQALGNRLGKSSLDDKAALYFEIPPDFKKIESSQVNAIPANERIALSLITAQSAAPTLQKFALDYQTKQERVFYLLDLSGDILQAKTILATGTITEMTWRGDIPARLQLALRTGEFSGEGFAPPESKNLYH